MPIRPIEVSTFSKIPSFVPFGVEYFTQDTADLYVGTGASSGPAVIAVNAGGGGSVSSVTFTGDGTVLSSVPSAAVTTAGTVSASLANAGPNVVFGNATASTAPPSYSQIVGGQIANAAVDLTTKVASVLPPANGGVANFVTSGQGYWHPQPSPVLSSFNAGNAIENSSNRVYMAQVILPYRTRVTQATFVTGAGTGLIAGQSLGYGIYSADGLTKQFAVVVNGVVSTSTAVTAVVSPPVIFAPGAYWVGWVCTNASAQFQNWAFVANTGLFGAAAGTTIRWGWNSGLGNTSTAGALPNSLNLPDTFLAQAMPIAFCEP